VDYNQRTIRNLQKRNRIMSEQFIEGLCEWLKETKGITKINIEDLVTYIPEYEKYLEDK
jgi:hypothetical protein